MALLTIALSLFIVTHLIPAFPTIKTGLISRIGHGPYIFVFSVFSLVSLGLIIYAKAHAPYVEIYQPPTWSHPFALVLMVPAIILSVARFLPGYIARLSRAPLFYATLLWVIAHLVANGDKASVLLFASLGAYACASRVIMIRQRPKAPVESIEANLYADITAIALGVAAYALLITLHGDIIGVAIWY